jgi:hypothetical protein
LPLHSTANGKALLATLDEAEVRKLLPARLRRLTCHTITSLDVLLAELEKAIDAGYRNADELLNDADFSKIRAEDRFRSIVRKLRAGDSKAKAKTDEEDDEDEEEGAARSQRSDRAAGLTRNRPGDSGSARP